jgi:hypothetical protein
MYLYHDRASCICIASARSIAVSQYARSMTRAMGMCVVVNAILVHAFTPHNDIPVTVCGTYLPLRASNRDSPLGFCHHAMPLMPLVQQHCCGIHLLDESSVI